MIPLKIQMKTPPHIVLCCPACRRSYDPAGGLLGCPHHRRGQEHTLTKQVAFGPSARAVAEDMRRSWRTGLRDPFRLFAAGSASRTLLGRQAYGQTLDSLNRRLKRWEGGSFRVTPLVDAWPLKRALERDGRLLIKNETGNVSGSHKGRHLMGSLLYLEALHRRRPGESRPVLTIYSCGNAALGAAVVARAGGFDLHAFVPDDVDPVVERLLRERQTHVHKYGRGAEAAGDPCYLAFRRAVEEKGWLPFSCSGNDNWSNIEGGETLGWETLMQVEEAGLDVTAMVVQVGGGALGRAISQAWRKAVDIGLTQHLPRIYVCQPEGGFPFVRAYLLLLARIAERNGLAWDLPPWDRGGNPRPQLERLKDFSRSHGSCIRRAADFARRHFTKFEVQTVLRKAALKRGDFMWAWDGAPPHSLAHGILDDETYDWFELAAAVLRSGGRADIIDEEQVARAHALARRHTPMTPCATGTSGLAGLLQLTAAGDIDPAENVILFFTGLDRSAT